jgi:hypothetical protein
VGIFIDSFRGNLGTEDAAEKAAGSGVDHRRFTLRGNDSTVHSRMSAVAERRALCGRSNV